MFSEKLKEETKTNHQRLEHLLIPKIKSIKTTDDYLWLLRVFYSYFGALENEINKAVDQRLLPDQAHRRKADLIAQDIRKLGGEVPELADKALIPRISDHNQALAALYVIEGSALGGQIISKMITNALGEKAEGALKFYTGYGDQTQVMWSQFKDAMNAQIVSEEEQKAAVDIANETFVKFRELAEQLIMDS